MTAGAINPPLGTDEQVIAEGWAFVPMPRSGFNTIAPIGTVIRIINRIGDHDRAKTLAQTSATAGFPLRRFMAVTLTSQRLIMWSASRFPRRRKTLLAQHSLTGFKSATLPYSSASPWPTVALTLSDGIAVRFRLDAAMAGELVRIIGHV